MNNSGCVGCETTPEAKERDSVWGKVYRARPEIKQRLKTYGKAYYDSPEGKKWREAYNKTYFARLDVKERQKRVKKAWDIKTKEHREAYSKAYYSRPEIKERRKAYWARPEIQELLRIYESTRRARISGGGGNHTVDEWLAVLETQNYRCNNYYCQADINGKGKAHKDHIQALTKGGTDYISNIQGLCNRCNIRKNAEDWGEFLNREYQRWISRLGWLPWQPRRWRSLKKEWLWCDAC